MVDVEFDWALLSKEPGQRDDYRILRSGSRRLPSGSRRLQAAALEKMINYFSPGSPSSESAGQPDALPWVTFTAAAVAGQQFVGVAVREWPDPPILDATGRATVPTRFFCLPLDAFHQQVGGFVELLDAVRELRKLDSAPDEAVTRTVSESGRWNRRERATHDPRLRAAAAVAGMLLDEQVTLAVKPGLEDPAARVAFLDLVAALLPAGTAGALSAGTWVDVTTVHHIRLAFGQALGTHAGPVDLTDLPPVDATGSPGQRYAALLDYLLGADEKAGQPVPAHLDNQDWSTSRLADPWPSGPPREPLGGEGPRPSRESVLSWLDNDREPRSLTQPGAIVDMLADAAAADLLYRARRQWARADDVRAYLRAVPTAGRRLRELVQALRPDAVPGDIDILARHWSDQGVREEAASLAHDLVRNECSYSDVELYLASAPISLAGKLTDALVRLADVTPGALSLAAGIIRAFHAHGDRLDGWEGIPGRLADRPALALTIVLRMYEAHAGVALRGSIDWITSAGGMAARVLTPFQIVLAGNTLPSPDDLKPLAEIATTLGGTVVDDAMQLLVLLAVSYQRQRKFPPAVAAWLKAEAEAQRFSAARRERWLTLRERHGLDPADQRAMWQALGDEPSTRGKRRRASDQGGDPGLAGPDLRPRWVSLPAAGPVTDEAERGVANWLDASQRELAAGPAYRPALGESGGGELVLFGDRLDKIAVAGFSQADPGRPSGPGGATAAAGPVPAVRYCWYTDIAALPAAAMNLGEAAQELDSTDGWPEAVAVSSGATRWAAAHIDSFGFGVVAAVAAHMVNQRLTIGVDPDAPWPSRAARASFLGAVLALLPAGALATTTVSTRSAPGRQFRLSFVSAPPSEQASRGPVWAVPFTTDPPRNGFGAHYHRRLLLARGFFHDTTTILTLLAAQRDRHDFGLIDDCCALVSAINPVFASEPPARKELGRARERARGVLSRRHLFDTDDDAATVEALLGGSITDLELALRYAGSLFRSRRLDDVLLGVLDNRGRRGERAQRISHGVAWLVVQYGAGDRLRPVLGQQPPVLIALVAEFIRSGRFTEARDWLTAVVHPETALPETAVFRRVLDPFPGAGPTTLEAVAHWGPDAVQALLLLARHAQDPRWFRALLPLAAPHVVAELGVEKNWDLWSGQ